MTEACGKNGGFFVRRVFISYRRSDAAGTTGRIYDYLCREFGADDIFMDTEGIEPGVDFHDVLTRQVASCQVLVAVIGPDWLSARNARDEQRLFLDDDYVRIEVATALERNIRVIPVLVEGALMPVADELPESLKMLARRNALELTHARFSTDISRLKTALDTALDYKKAPVDPDLPPLQGFLNSYGASVPSKVFFFASDLPEKLLNTASLRCEKPDDETVFLLIDLTLMRNANNAMLLTQKGVHYYNDPSIRGKGAEPRFFSYELIRRAEIRKANWPNISIDGEVINGGGGPDVDLLLDFLLALKQGLNRIGREGGDVRSLFSA